MWLILHHITCTEKRLYKNESPLILHIVSQTLLLLTIQKKYFKQNVLLSHFNF